MHIQYLTRSCSMSGRFIVFEGGEGAGKDTQIDLLRTVVNEDDYVFVKDPGSTDAGIRLREVVLHSTHIGYTAEFLTFLAARAQLVTELIAPALTAGKTVVANRFDLSTYAYQIHGRERHDVLPFLKEAMAFVMQGIAPDVVILFDVPPEVGLKRAARIKVPDRMEHENILFHERVRAGYLAHVHDYTEHHIIDALLPKEDIFAQVRKIVGV